MKTMYRISALLVSLLLAVNVIAVKAIPGSIFPIHVVFSAKSYWDGPSKSCLPREKGGCCHLWLEGMEPGPGEISGELVMLRGKIIQLTVSRVKGMNNETYLKYFSDGKFTLEGPITFEPNVLTRLGIEGYYVVPAGTYPFTSNGDVITITFK
jgi:hypothetical protein